MSLFQEGFLSGQTLARPVVLVAIAFLGTSAPARGQTPAGCVWVRAENDGAGAGAVVDVKRRWVVTCRHLAADRTKVDVVFPWEREGKLVTDRRLYLGNRTELRERGLLVTAKVVKTSDDLDLALLELETLPAGARAVTLATRSPRIGERLRVIGNRLDLDTLWNISAGPVRTTGRLADGYFWRGKKLAANAAVLIGQLPTEEGDSGGPTFNDQGELVGLVTALRRQCPGAAVAASAAEVRAFAGLPEPNTQPEEPIAASRPAESLLHATVWVRPTSTDIHLAGVLIDKDCVLTGAKGLARGDRVGIAFPVWENGRTITERATYKDSVGLALQGCWRRGTVRAVDSERDLALLALDSTPAAARPIALASRMPQAGDDIHVMNHPSGLEFAWVYAGGVVRQRGPAAIAPAETARRVECLLCQVPAQSGSPGGPVVNGSGELVGLLTSKESAQQVGYAVSTREIAAFLDAARVDKPPTTLAGFPVRFEAWLGRLLAATALGLAQQAEADRTAGRMAAASAGCDKALSLDAECVTARLCRVRMLTGNAAMAELDRAVERGPFDRTAILMREERACEAKDWRKARGDLERLLEVDPLDAPVRQRLVKVLLELHEDARASSSVADALRADPRRLSSVAADLLALADELAQKFPSAPGVPAGWLAQTLTVAAKAAEGDVKARLSAALASAEKASDDAARLSALRKALVEIATR